MDILSIAKNLLSSNIVNTVSKDTGEKKNDVQNVLQSALPDVVSNLISNNSPTKVTTVKKGGNSLELLGSNINDILAKITKTLGISKEQVLSILTSALPLIVEAFTNLVSTDTSKKKKTSKKTSGSLDLADIASNLMSNASDGLDLGDIASALFSSNSAAKKPTTKKTTTKKSTAKKTTAAKKTSKTSSTAKKSTAKKTTKKK